MLYMQGEDGEDGKSVAWRVISREFGNEFSHSITQGDTLSNKSTHGTSACYGKRLIYLPDWQNPLLLKYPLVKQITGGDPISVEYKYQTGFSAVLDARVVCTSNYPLNVDNETFERSRLLWITVKPPQQKDPGWEDRLHAEYEKFLQFAKWCYGEVCSDHYSVVCAAADKLVEACIEDNEEEIVERLGEQLEIDQSRSGDDGFCITRSEFKAIVNETGLSRTSQDIRRIKRVLARNGFDDFAGDGKKVKVDGRRVKVYRGLKRRAVSYFGNKAA